MTYGQMVAETSANAMLGMLVLFFEALAIVSGLLSTWTLVALHRSR